MDHWNKVGRWAFFVIGTLITIASVTYNAWQLGNAGIALGLPIPAWTAIGVVIVIGSSAFMLVQNQRELEATRRRLEEPNAERPDRSAGDVDDELRRQRQALICAWRAMVTTIHTRMQVPGNKSTTTELLERHSAFPSIRTHLSERSKQALGNTIIVPPDGSTMGGALHSILDDIDRTENEWGLN
jgi:hypothetical protein